MWHTEVSRIYPEEQHDKILYGKAFVFASNPQNDGYQCGLA